MQANAVRYQALTWYAKFAMMTGAEVNTDSFDWTLKEIVRELKSLGHADRGVMLKGLGGFKRVRLSF
jgi:hypothetical protein